ncbi:MULTISPECIES: FKBP-type peptidyl-prolyl cis-trans isomerase [unclassified Curtobacterium]|uniref:FKBP-type peptidyl-prolyl cis-trans isomerase n=1 Tax=unclassified Curtobacterium TaxID=257496 RepID=UPI000DAAB04C|nr:MULTISPECIES: peptidylprolyl isomerase [unclassified Curtobacterium]PZE67535.1 peptidylprolyl isomerase [Curtobacterium sp. MCBD17_021]WIB27967.1 peptidylprolyl isomerase [Curtobacterium sp. MCSS17_015]
MRTIPALVVTIGLVASLTACAAPGAGTSSTCAPSGRASEAVSASGAFGSEPKVTVPAGLTATGTQVSVLRQGDGRTIGDGTPVVLEYTLVDGATGEVAQTSGYTGASTPITAGSTNAGALGEALECAQVGDRLAVVLPKTALSGGAPSGSGAEDAAVFVVDVQRAFDSRATGSPQLAGDRMPAVVLAPDGAPGITIPSWSAPEDDEQHLLRKGDGATLTAEDTAIVKYTAVTWGSSTTDSTVAGSSWTDGSGAQPLPLAEGQVVDGIRNALLGRHVGDQVLAIVHQQGAAYAYVIDVLGAMPS